ncbi:8-amino-7-oxononanoate synthase-like isoform X1 [Hylaeus volcanicus]|uniref:8-amino-7-oxononanoate synthase-like isoform X1 n=1 Tax=Hylaeus volcanicus TaxID=313075 RepID=UPI0023B7B395|nr:8-amino-7-oxononanoate synthase-like isoform X1 [Hylaeus volcanicus]
MFFTHFLSQIESPRCIIVLVAVIGVLLAYLTDDGVFYPATFSKNTKEKESDQSCASTSCTNSLQITLFNYFNPFQRWYSLVQNSGFNAFFFVKSLFFNIKQCRTKRHLAYLQQKKYLKLPIRPNETEVDSYLDCKNFMKESWPFMWEVSNVKSEKITCGSHSCIPMSSYSYLNLLCDSRVQEAAIAAARQWSSGNYGPRMLGGNTSILKELEATVASFFKRDASLVCATGYLACMSSTAVVCNAESITFADSRIHASLRAGLKLGGGCVIFFKHNDFEDCEKMIKKNRHKFPTAWLIIESVYSMDGDIADLPKASQLCKQYNINLMVDEAHGLGVLGETGHGIEEYYNLPKAATLLVGTFSKSVASIGGYVAGDKRFIAYLTDHAVGSVFSAPLPGYCAGAALKSFEIMSTDISIIKRVRQNSLKLRQKLTSSSHWPQNYPEHHKFLVTGDKTTSVIPIIFPNDLSRVINIAGKMKEKGFMCSAVGYPACPLSAPRFRITATSCYTDELIDQFTKTFIETCVEIPPTTA